MMKNVKYLARLLAPIALLCGGAATAADGGFYAGFSLGESHYDFQGGTSGKFQIVSSSYAENYATTLALTGGYRLNSNIAFEASYMDLGAYRYSESGRNTTAPVNSGTLDAEVKGAGIGLAAVLSMPLGTSWDVHGKIGGLQTKTQATVIVRSQTLTQQKSKETKSEIDTMYTLGVGYTVSEHYSFALDVTSILEAGSALAGQHDLNIASLGFQYRF
jgi:hypothetical protein